MNAITTAYTFLNDYIDVPPQERDRSSGTTDFVDACLRLLLSHLCIEDGCLTVPDAPIDDSDDKMFNLPPLDEEDIERMETYPQTVCSMVIGSMPDDVSSENTMAHPDISSPLTTIRPISQTYGTPPVSTPIRPVSSPVPLQPPAVDVSTPASNVPHIFLTPTEPQTSQPEIDRMPDVMPLEGTENSDDNFDDAASTACPPIPEWGEKAMSFLADDDGSDDGNDDDSSKEGRSGEEVPSEDC